MLLVVVLLLLLLLVGVCIFQLTIMMIRNIKLKFDQQTNYYNSYTTGTLVYDFVCVSVCVCVSSSSLIVVID